MTELLESSSSTLESTTVWINRTAKTVKGGRNFAFAALVVVGDRAGNVGLGYGKGRGVPNAIEKAQKDARKKMFKIPLSEGTLPHEVEGRFGASKVRMIPAAPGTGVIAGGTVRAVLEMVGVQDCLTKAYGSTNKRNVCEAVMTGLQALRTREQIAELRGVEIETSEVDEMLATSKASMDKQRAQAEERAAAVAEKAKANVDKQRKIAEQAQAKQEAEEKEKAEAQAKAAEETKATEQAKAADETKAAEEAKAADETKAAEEAKAADDANGEQKESTDAQPEASDASLEADAATDEQATESTDEKKSDS